MLSRRHFLASLSAAAFTTALPTRYAWSATPDDRRFIFVILRGAMDGLAAVPPIGDSNYTTARGAMALPEDAVLQLDARFGLHPAMESLYPLWQKGQMNIVHAVASPYRSRSHFDAQDILENGSTSAAGTHSGWLGRAVASLNRDKAIAISPQMPLVLQGGTNLASSWYTKTLANHSDTDFMAQVKAMYAGDAQLNPYLQKAIAAENTALMALSEEDRKSGKKATALTQFPAAVKSCAAFLKQPQGPRIAVMETAGWDTHARQGTVEGGLANMLGHLADGLAMLPQELGQPVWEKTVVIVATEFGRTVRANGTSGTDHGTASAAFVLGGGLRGGKVLGEWPGLEQGQLYEGRDLRPTTDMRSLFKTALGEHLGMSQTALERDVFPDSGNAPLIRGLI